MRYGRCLVTAAVSYSSALSKNARIGYSYHGKIYIRKEAKAAEAVLHRELTSAVKAAKIKFYQNKVYLEVFVWKSRSNTDAVNFVDVICDVLKSVISVDDRYFCIKGLDFEIDRKNPRILLKLYQPSRRDEK